MPSVVAPRLATTLLLLRDGPVSPEVLMVQRHVAVDFAAGALVFPGGRIEEEDGDPAVLAHCQPVAGAGAEEMALRVAGIRETFEEVHMLLAREAGSDTLLSAEALAGLEARLGTALGRPPIFAELVASGRIELATDLLVPYAHWITPAARPKRYDTHFFLAPAPADQQPVHDGREAVESVWIAPEQAVAEADAGRLTLVFVTRMNLLKLARSATVAEALAAARADTIVTVCPEIADTPGGKVLRIPLAAGYGVSEFPARPTSLA